MASVGGAFYPTDTGANYLNQSSYSSSLPHGIYFSANTGASAENPMVGHAIATDNDGGIRPYNISMIPIIIVS